MRHINGVLAVVVGAAWLSGCASVERVVPLGAKTPSVFGNVKLYGTDNVPFEYEEIAAVSQTYSAFDYGYEDCLKLFAARVQQLGADAVLNFKVDQDETPKGFLLVVTVISPSLGWLHLSGTAVKIKRP